MLFKKKKVQKEASLLGTDGPAAPFGRSLMAAEGQHMETRLFPQ